MRPSGSNCFVSLQGLANSRLCWHMHNALSLLATRVNDVVGGIRLSQTETRWLQILIIDDGGKTTSVRDITTELLDGRITARPVDFLLAPYSSSLSEAASDVANQRGALLMSSGASETSVFKTRSLSFGMMAPSAEYLKNGVELLHKKGIRSIALLLERNDSASLQYCNGAIDKAEELGMRILATAEVSLQPNSTQVARALDKFRASKPDAVIGCTRYGNCAEFLAQAAADPGFYVKAMIFTLCVTEPRFKELPRLQTAYVLGVAPWSENDTQTSSDDLLGSSPAYFATKYQGTFGEIPPYQAVATYAGGLLLVDAIEASGSLEPQRVAAALARISKRTVYGNVSFDANRQNRAPFFTFQKTGDLQPVVVTVDTVIIPMPPWAQRECEVLDRCVGDGSCTHDGTCSGIDDIGNKFVMLGALLAGAILTGGTVLVIWRRFRECQHMLAAVAKTAAKMVLSLVLETGKLVCDALSCYTVLRRSNVPSGSYKSAYLIITCVAMMAELALIIVRSLNMWKIRTTLRKIDRDRKQFELHASLDTRRQKVESFKFQIQEVRLRLQVEALFLCNILVEGVLPRFWHGIGSVAFCVRAQLFPLVARLVQVSPNWSSAATSCFFRTYTILS